MYVVHHFVAEAIVAMCGVQSQVEEETLRSQMNILQEFIFRLYLHKPQPQDYNYLKALVMFKPGK